MFEYTLNTANPETYEISGAELTKAGQRAQSTLISVQIIPSGDGDFEIQIHGGVNSVKGIKFSRFGTFTQADDTLLTPIHVSLGCKYKLVHISGIECIVRLTG